jgi:hypothetical protein
VAALTKALNMLPGVYPSGVRADFGGADNGSRQLIKEEYTLTATFAADLMVIGPGEAQNFVALILQHITIVPDGTVAALSDVFSVDCR